MYNFSVNPIAELEDRKSTEVHQKSIEKRIHELESTVLNVVLLFVKLIRILYANTVFKLSLQSLVKDLRHS